MADAGFRAMKGGVDLNGEADSGSLPGVCLEAAMVRQSDICNRPYSTLGSVTHRDESASSGLMDNFG
jgi:hypothetical protein